ncbi:glycosyltransferase family 39 protein [Streptomyces phaeochromogenes]|uniref:Glycosyltransferase family 39 protein n=1 Tax=Streptomyces phaeochromogenes TaxID=1923 RepID=A0ABZ1H5G1_STRPH|nr:glycosyltransferase family 39 protein [Streptomyces phaeochromogenes]WSD12514.1 glycosyltransferase family 39 protein [Streptomyces phaeochromogenes]
MSIADFDIIDDTEIAPQERSRTVPSLSRRRFLTPLLLPVSLSALLGVWGIRRDGTLWHDEAVTLELASRSLPDLWQTLGNIDAVHGAYYFLMHGLFGLFGTDLLVLRLPSVLAGVLSTAGVTALGVRLSGTRAGILAGLSFAALPDVQRYSQEGRSYSLVCALVVWATYLLVRAVLGCRAPEITGRSSSMVPWIAYGAFMLAACILHQFAAFALIAHAFALPACARRPWACTALLVAAGVAPLAALGMAQSGQVAWIDGVTGSEYQGFAVLVSFAILLSYLASSGNAGKVSPEVPVSLRAIALPLFILPTALLMLISLYKPLYVERYVLYGLVGLALLLGAVLDRVPELGRNLRVATVIVVALAIALLVPESLRLRAPESRSDNVTDLAIALSREYAPGDGILYLSVKRRAWSLAYPSVNRGMFDIAQELTPAASHDLYGTELPSPQIRARMRSSPRILVVTEPVGHRIESSGTEMMKERVLAEYFTKGRTIRINGARVIIYEPRTTATETELVVP